MPLEDYFKKMNFVEYRRVPDGFGGWKGQWEVGAEFKGLITLASETVQNTEALRGNLAKQYKLSTLQNVPLKKGDKIAFDFLNDGRIEYAELTSDGIIPPTQSGTAFVLYSAQSWELKNE